LIDNGLSFSASLFHINLFHYLLSSLYHLLLCFTDGFKYSLPSAYVIVSHKILPAYSFVCVCTPATDDIAPPDPDLLAALLALFENRIFLDLVVEFHHSFFFHILPFPKVVVVVTHVVLIDARILRDASGQDN